MHRITTQYYFIENQHPHLNFYVKDLPTSEQQLKNVLP